MLPEDHHGFCYVPALVKRSMTLLQYRKRPLELCPECLKPLPEIRTVNMVVHEGACKRKRRDKITARANKRRKKARRSKLTS
jgi:hypothetical protein